jgi:hypothetical protein
VHQPSSKGGVLFIGKEINGAPMRRWKKDVFTDMLCINTGRGNSLKCGSSGRGDRERNHK